MRNLTNESPNLFANEGVLAGAVQQKQENKSDALAREFVKWCCGFGSDFRNSPDVTNLRFWSQKVKLKLKDAEQVEVLDQARRLFAKKLEQITRKPDATLPQMNTMVE